MHSSSVPTESVVRCTVTTSIHPSQQTTLALESTGPGRQAELSAALDRSPGADKAARDIARKFMAPLSATEYV